MKLFEDYNFKYMNTQNSDCNVIGLYNHRHPAGDTVVVQSWDLVKTHIADMINFSNSVAKQRGLCTNGAWFKSCHNLYLDKFFFTQLTLFC